MQQIEDCCGRNEDMQELGIYIEDGGGGAYVVLKTERFALDYDQIDEFCEHLKKLVRQSDSSDLYNM